jgi:hypothetical protein
MGKQLLVFVFAVCAAVAGWTQSPAHISSDSATIYLYRAKDVIERGYRLRVNAGPQFRIGPEEVREIKVPAGLVEISARLLGLNPGIYSFFVEAGSTHYLRVHDCVDLTELSEGSIEILEVTERMFTRDLALIYTPKDDAAAAEKNTATVYLYRATFPRVRNFNVQVNGQSTIALSQQKVDTLYLQPGRHVFQISVFSRLGSDFTLDLRAGEVVYLRVYESYEANRLRNRLEFVEVTANMFWPGPR